MKKILDSDRFSKYYDKEAGITKWSNIFEVALLEGERLYLPDIAQELYDSNQKYFQEKVRSIIYYVKKLIEESGDYQLVTCHPRKTYRLVNGTNKAGVWRENKRRNNEVGYRLESLSRSFEAIIHSHPELLPKAKRRVWQLEDKLRKMESSGYQLTSNEHNE